VQKWTFGRELERQAVRWSTIRGAKESAIDTDGFLNPKGVTMEDQSQLG